MWHSSQKNCLLAECSPRQSPSTLLMLIRKAPGNITLFEFVNRGFQLVVLSCWSWPDLLSVWANQRLCRNHFKSTWGGLWLHWQFSSCFSLNSIIKKDFLNVHNLSFQILGLLFISIIIILFWLLIASTELFILGLSIDKTLYNIYRPNCFDLVN